MNCLSALGSTAILAACLVGCSSGTESPPRRDQLGDGSSGATSGNIGNGSNGAGTVNAAVGAVSTSGGIDIDETPDDSTCGSVLPVVLRDFKGSDESGGHVDFEISARNVIGPDGQVYKGWNDVGCGLVEPTLGPDSKPIFFTGTPDGIMVRSGVGRQKRVVTGPGCWTAANPTPTGICNIGSCVPWDFDPPTFEIESTTSFDQWYNTISGVNVEIPAELPLTDDGTGVYVFDSSAFFPLDNQGFMNTPGQAHNYHFTTEAHVRFTYQAGQVFTFRGDDDLWIFVNGKLALDVGGLHQALEGTIAFDAKAEALGITPGGQYQMDIFHAERQTSESNFRIETNISCFEPVDIIK
ncbi:MAG TPA: fibro-slime domain-containing protein [Polyangiaceae bacterium]|nr:fibro-slime domain-containing protein [Polyangiaceae bacterium]